MKALFIPFITLFLFMGAPGSAQEMTINLSGDSNTEQAAKLELIRILQERLNKLTVSQLNSRIIVSTGVRKYYKVDEIIAMNKEMYGLRSKYVTLAGNLEKGNPGFTASAGNGFSYAYMRKYNAAVEKARDLTQQLTVLLKDGKPIMLPPMPSFSISQSTGDNFAKGYVDAMNGIMNKYGVKTKEEMDALSADQRDALMAEIGTAQKEFEATMKDHFKDQTKQSLVLLGNLVGTAFGVPGAGTMIAGLVSGGGAGAIAGLVGTIVDKFAIPDDYYDSETLKLTDAERLKIIDELHIRMSELYQQVIAMGTSMSNEAKVRYNELSQPRNEQIIYGPKK